MRPWPRAPCGKLHARRPGDTSISPVWQAVIPGPSRGGGGVSVRTPRPSGVTPGAWALGSHCSSKCSHFPGADRGDPASFLHPGRRVTCVLQPRAAVRHAGGLAQAPPPLPAPRPKARGHGWGRGCSPSPSTGNLGVSGGNAGLGVWERLSQDPGFAGGFGRLKKQSRGRSQPRVLGRTLGAEEG